MLLWFCCCYDDQSFRLLALSILIACLSVMCSEPSVLLLLLSWKTVSSLKASVVVVAFGTVVAMPVVTTIVARVVFHVVTSNYC